AEGELRQEVVCLQETLDAVMLLAVRAEEEDGRRPLDVETLHGSRVLPDVNADGDEVFADQLVYAGLGIHLGLQPSASPSERSGGEVEEERAVFPFRLFAGRP